MKWLKKKQQALSVQEALPLLVSQLSERTGWKYLKSQQCLKKVVKDLVFEVNFFSSKWNVSYERIEIECECQIWCKKFDNKLSVHSGVAFYKFKPSEEMSYWDITFENSLQSTADSIFVQMEDSILPLCRKFEEDFTEAVKVLAGLEMFHKFNVELDFIEMYAGMEYVLMPAKSFFDNLSDNMKEKILCYEPDTNQETWLANRSNQRYLAEHKDILKAGDYYETN